MAAGTPAKCAFRVRGKFFERLDDLRILRRVTRPRAHMREAQPLQKSRDMALVIGDAEAILDDLLEIDAPPAHDAVEGRIGTGLDNLCQLSELLG